MLVDVSQFHENHLYKLDNMIKNPQRMREFQEMFTGVEQGGFINRRDGSTTRPGSGTPSKSAGSSTSQPTKPSTPMTPTKPAGNGRQGGKGGDGIKRDDGTQPGRKTGG